MSIHSNGVRIEWKCLLGVKLLQHRLESLSGIKKEIGLHGTIYHLFITALSCIVLYRPFDQPFFVVMNIAVGGSWWVNSLFLIFDGKRETSDWFIGVVQKGSMTVSFQVEWKSTGFVFISTNKKHSILLIDRKKLLFFLEEIKVSLIIWTKTVWSLISIEKNIAVISSSRKIVENRCDQILQKWIFQQEDLNKFWEIPILISTNKWYISIDVREAAYRKEESIVSDSLWSI